LAYAGCVSENWRVKEIYRGLKKPLGNQNMDQTCDLLIRIKNAYMANLKTATVSYSRPKENLIRVLQKNGYIRNYQVTGEKAAKSIEIDLRYAKKVPALIGVKIISKPGLRVYVKAKEIKNVFGGSGINILSTPKGIMTGKEARIINLGGELICQVW